MYYTIDTYHIMALLLSIETSEGVLRVTHRIRHLVVGLLIVALATTGTAYAAQGYIKLQGCVAVICVSGTYSDGLHVGVSLNIGWPLASGGLVLGYTPSTVTGWQASANAAVVGPFGGGVTYQKGGVGGEVCSICSPNASLNVGYTW